MEDRLEISNSKVKKMGFIIMGFIFVVIGLTNSLLGIVQLAKFYSYFFLVVGMAVVVGGIIMLVFLKDPVVILTKEELIYNPKENGFVSWTDIEGFTDYSLNNHHIILVRLKDADGFIEKQKDEKVKKRMKLGLRTHETPISIAPILLEMSRSELKETLQRYLIKYGNS